MDLIILGNRDSNRGVTKGTLKKIESSSRKWNEFTADHNLDVFLRHQDSSSKIEIFSAFAYSLRHNYAGKTARDELRGTTVRAEINSISASFRSMGFPDPIRNDDQKLHQHLERQLRFYENADSPESREAPLPYQLFLHILLDDTGTSIDEAKKASHHWCLLSWGTFM